MGIDINKLPQHSTFSYFIQYEKDKKLNRVYFFQDNTVEIHQEGFNFTQTFEYTSHDVSPNNWEKTGKTGYLISTYCNIFEHGTNYVYISTNNDKISQKLKNCGIQPPPKQGKSQQQEYFFIDKAETMKYLQGQDITISCEVDGDVELESGGVLFQYQLEGQDTYTDVKAEVTTSSTGKKRIWVRVKLP